MQPSPKRIKIIALVTALLFLTPVLITTVLHEEFVEHPTPLEPESLGLLRTILLFVSAYGLVVVLAFQFWRTKFLNRFSARPNRFSSETRFQIINYPLLISPAIYGHVLYYCGISLREFFYWIGAGIIMTLVWFIVEFRRT